MGVFWDITIGEVATIAIALFALIAAAIIGRFQYRINEKLVSLQDSVELYVTSDFLYNINAEGKKIFSLNSPAIIVKNLSTKRIYLNKYCYNGSEYPTHDEVIPSVAQLHDACYHIKLPTDGSIHVSFEIYFSDWSNNKWTTSGYADLINGVWKVISTPCKRLRK